MIETERVVRVHIPPMAPPGAIYEVALSGLGRQASPPRLSFETSRDRSRHSRQNPVTLVFVTVRSVPQLRHVRSTPSIASQAGRDRFDS